MLLLSFGEMGHEYLKLCERLLLKPS